MKRILLLFFMLGILSTVHAQFGIRAGLSSGNFAVTNFNSKVGFHAGGYYKAETTFFSIEPGIQFSQKGYETTNPQTNNLIKEELNYIDIPVLLRYEVLPAISAFAGPQGSFLVSRNYKETGNNQTSTKPVKGYDLGGVIGLGVSFPTGVNLQLSYDIGLLSLNYFDSNVKNRVLKISAGFAF